MATRKGTDPADGSYDGSTDRPVDRPTDHPADPGYGLGAHPMHPLDGGTDEPTTTDTTTVPVAPASGKKTRSVGGNRHLTSLVLALVAVPVGYGFLDYATYRAGGFLSASPDPGRLPDRLVVMTAAAAACFLVAALAGRVSGMGPLVAGLVWGVAPAAWVILDYPSYVSRLNDLPEFWNNTGFGLATIGIAVFPVAAGLLVGLGLAGKWRRPVPTSRW